MNDTVIQQVLDEIREIPETDQQRVLGFIRSLKRKPIAGDVVPPRHSQNPALQRIDGMLVFTGDIGNPHLDWLHIVREEREADIIRQTFAQGARQ